MRGAAKLAWAVALPGVVLCCTRDKYATPAPLGTGPVELALPGAVMIGAGDIAVCGTNGDESTGRIVDSVLAADSAAKVESVVFTLGDNAYPSGSSGVDNDFPRCFSPSWGTRRIMKVIHPAPGNHDYDSGSGAPYFKFFGERAGPRGKGYYSYDVVGWHVISLDSELYFESGNVPEARAQEDWLRAVQAIHQSLIHSIAAHSPRALHGRLFSPSAFQLRGLRRDTRGEESVEHPL